MFHNFLDSVGKTFGIPDTVGMTRFGDNIWNRAGVDAGDKALSYVNGVIDRIINKARGILPFNLLLLAVIALVDRATIGKIAWTLWLAGLSFGLSSLILLLTMFWPHIGDLDDYSSYDREFRSTILVIRNRALALIFATGFSVVGFLLVAISVLGKPVLGWLNAL